MTGGLFEELCPKHRALEMLSDFRNVPRLCLNGKRWELVRHHSPRLQDGEMLLEVILEFQKASYFKGRAEIMASGPAP